MKAKNSFYSWLALKTQIGPTATTDAKILAFSSQFLKGKKKSSFSNWKLSGSLALTAAVVLIVMINKNPSPMIPGPTLISEAPEMILHYRDIELMADASHLSDADWEKINGQK